MNLYYSQNSANQIWTNLVFFDFETIFPYIIYIDKYNVLLDHIWNSCVEFQFFRISQISQLSIPVLIPQQNYYLKYLKFKH